MYMYIHTYMYMHTYIHVHTCTYTYIHVHTHIHVHMYIHTYMYIHTCTYTHTCTYIHSYMHYIHIYHCTYSQYIHTCIALSFSVFTKAECLLFSVVIWTFQSIFSFSSSLLRLSRAYHIWKWYDMIQCYNISTSSACANWAVRSDLVLERLSIRVILCSWNR